MLPPPCTKEELRKANRRSDAWEVFKAMLSNPNSANKSYHAIIREAYVAVKEFEKFQPEHQE